MQVKGVCADTIGKRTQFRQPARCNIAKKSQGQVKIRCRRRTAAAGRAGFPGNRRQRTPRCRIRPQRKKQPQIAA